MKNDYSYFSLKQVAGREFVGKHLVPKLLNGDHSAFFRPGIMGINIVNIE